MVSAWSFGTAQRGKLNSTSNNPGPSQYTVDKKQKRQPPSWKIGSGQRTKFEANQTPGPNAYRPQTASGGEKFSMASKYKFKSDQFVPGPGAYNPRPSSAMKAPPQYSMGSKYDEVDKQGFKKIVGPGSYQIKSTFGKTGPKIGSSKRDQLYSSNHTPGPGQYQQSRPQTGSKYKMGTSQRGELYKTQTDTIGPGQYEIKSTFDHNKGITISSKRQQQEQIEASKVPGPGSYNPTKQPLKSAPSFKIGNSSRGNLSGNDQKTPGVGTYYSGYNKKLNGTQVKFGTDVRKPLNGKIDTPGPGQYSYQSKVVEGPKFSVKGATQVDPITREKINTPAPGQYQPSTSFTQTRPASAKIGTSTRPDFYKQRDTPGPGNYTTAAKKSTGPAFGFGTSKRSELKKTDEPGPGNYNVQSTFADVPKYAQNHSIRK